MHYDLRFRYLAGELRPDFRTINRFRMLHVEDFREVLRQTVRIAREAGLAKLGRVAIDGTKIRANTSRHKAMSRGRLGPRGPGIQPRSSLLEAEGRMRRPNATLIAHLLDPSLGAPRPKPLHPAFTTPVQARLGSAS